jgi:hypothetical protein
MDGRELVVRMGAPVVDFRRLLLLPDEESIGEGEAARIG